MDAQVFQKSRSYLEILGAGRVKWNKYYNKNPKIFDAIVQNLEARTWRPGFIDPCLEFVANGYYGQVYEIPLQKHGGVS